MTHMFHIWLWFEVLVTVTRRICCVLGCNDMWSSRDVTLFQSIIYIYVMWSCCLHHLGICNYNYLSFLLFWSVLPTHCRCRGFLLHLFRLIDWHTHTHTHTHLVGLHWLRDWSIVETSTCTTHNTRKTNSHVPGRIRIRNPSRWVATDLHVRPHGHQDWLITIITH